MPEGGAVGVRYQVQLLMICSNTHILFFYLAHPSPFRRASSLSCCSLLRTLYVRSSCVIPAIFNRIHIAHNRHWFPQPGQTPSLALIGIRSEQSVTPLLCTIKVPILMLKMLIIERTWFSTGRWASAFSYLRPFQSILKLGQKLRCATKKAFRDKMRSRGSGRCWMLTHSLDLVEGRKKYVHLRLWKLGPVVPSPFS